METTNARKSGGPTGVGKVARGNALFAIRAAVVKVFVLLATIGRAGGAR